MFLSHHHITFLLDTFCLVQDLFSINAIVIPIHTVIPNPYTILSCIPDITHFSVLDPKDVFSLNAPKYPFSKSFAFTWTDPEIPSTNLDCPP